MFWWGWLLYPFIFLTWFAKFFSTWLVFTVVLCLYLVPQSFLDWLLWKLTIGVYFWLLWILGTTLHLCIIVSSPLWHLCVPFWYLFTLVGGIFLSPHPSGTSLQCQSPPVLWALPCVVGVFTETYSLIGWMTLFLYHVDSHVGSFSSISSFACVRIFCVCHGMASIIS